MLFLVVDVLFEVLWLDFAEVELSFESSDFEEAEVPEEEKLSSLFCEPATVCCEYDGELAALSPLPTSFFEQPADANKTARAAPTADIRYNVFLKDINITNL